MGTPGNASKKGEKLEARLLNCPFCGGRPNIDRWVNLTENGVIYCAAFDFTLPPTVWNRRTPDLTEALARLKALEDGLRQDGNAGFTRAEVCADNAGSLINSLEWLAGSDLARADEIAAIRKVMGARDSPS